MTSKNTKLWFKVCGLEISDRSKFLEILSTVLNFKFKLSNLVWIEDVSSPFLYQSRWKPQLVFVCLTIDQAIFLDESPIKSIFELLKEKGTFQTFTEEEILPLKGKPFDPLLIDKKVFILDGPLDTFIGTVDSYNEEERKYKVGVVLLSGRTFYTFLDADSFQLHVKKDEENV